MTIWQDSLDAIYASEQGVDAVLSVGTAGSDVSLRMLDKTGGVQVGDPNEPGVTTIEPVAYVRMSELVANAITRQQVDGSTVTIGGRNWRVESHVLRPTPDGELRGELCMFLMGDPLNG